MSYKYYFSGHIGFFPILIITSIMTRTFLVRSSPISWASKALSPMGLRLYELTMGINATYPLGMPMSVALVEFSPPNFDGSGSILVFHCLYDALL
jgi:hypothetical protein